MKAPGSGRAENVCTLTVQQDLCIGCGICAAVCPTGHLVMNWTPVGTLEPAETTRCLPKCVRCLAVCPFLDNPEDETTLAQSRFGHLPSVQHTPETGYYLSAYVGSAERDRERGASGGMASWFLATLLETKAVDQVICVRSNPDAARLFAYGLAASPEEVRAGAKSAYYPVELSAAVTTVLREDKRYAVIGLPCTLKALRLAMVSDRRIRERVVVLAGLVCGQTKSRVFAEYLSRSKGIAPGKVRSFSFRDKDPSRPASNFLARIATAERTELLSWSGLYSQTWLSGEFTPRACRFCDDVFAEVADITFMDAWLPQYAQDGRGTSIVLVRSEQARAVMQTGMAQGRVSLQPIAIEDVIASQAGVVEQKRTHLAYRLWLAGQNGGALRKRLSPVRPPWFMRQLLVTGEQLRKASHAVARAANSGEGNWMQYYQTRTRNIRWRLNVLRTAVRWGGNALDIGAYLLRRSRRLVHRMWTGKQH